MEKWFLEWCLSVAICLPIDSAWTVGQILFIFSI
jgi:hypothetical protein